MDDLDDWESFTDCGASDSESETDSLDEFMTEPAAVDEIEFAHEYSDDEDDPMDTVVEPASPAQAASWAIRFQRQDGFNQQNAYHRRSMNWQHDIAQAGDLSSRVHDALDALESLKLDIPTLLYSLSGAVSEFRSDQRFANERGLLTSHPDLLEALDGLERHCSRRDKKRQAENLMLRFSTGCVKRRINNEISAVQPIMKMSSKEISPESLLTLDIERMMEDSQRLAPTMWEIYVHAATTRRQIRRNKIKHPKPVWECIASLSFCLSSPRLRF
jgi:hypothetical protein